jgi:hypothetical protein
MDNDYIFRDRLIDILLEEIIGGGVPPDLSKRILQRAIAGEMPRYAREDYRSANSALLWRKLLFSTAAVLFLAISTFFAIRYINTEVQKDKPLEECIIQKTGDVKIDNDRIETSGNSFCRVGLNDGTVAAIGEKSILQVIHENNSRVMKLEKGNAYLDISRQTTPFMVRLGESQLKITGTKLFLNTSRTDSTVEVLEGKTVYSINNSSITLEKGQRATYKGHFISVMPGRLLYKDIEWLDKIGISSRKLVSSFRLPDSVILPRQIDFTRYDVYEGQWEVLRDGKNVMLVQTNPETQGVIFFGTQRWMKGILRLKFRVKNVSTPESAVHIGFLYKDAWESFGVKQQLHELIKSGEWIECRVPFEVLPDNRFVISNMELWQDSKTSKKRVSLSFEKNEQNTRSSIKRTACRIGLITSGCSVEFKDIYLEKAVPLDIKPIALYNFKDGKGTVVHDISGTGQPMDLNIQKSELVEWTSRGLLVKGTACIESVQTSKLVDAWKQNGALTFEFWLKSSPQKSLKNSYVVLSLVERNKGYFTYSRTYDVEDSPEELNHLVIVVTRHGNDCRTELYCDGVLEKVNEMENMSLTLEKLTSIQLSGLFPWKPHAEFKGWIGEYRSFAIYDYAFSPEDVRRYYEGGNEAGLIAWYRFDEGDGSYVRDYADTEENLDLTIKNQNIKWLQRGIKISENAQIKSSLSTKISRALSESGGATIEIWAKSENTVPNQLYSFCRMTGQNGSSIALTHRNLPNNHLIFFSTVFTLTNDEVFVTGFVNNSHKIGERLFERTIASQLAHDPLWLELPLAENTKSYENVLPWRGTLYSLKIFGKIFSAEEIAEHYEREKYNFILKSSEGKYVNTRLIYKDDFESGIKNWQTVAIGRHLQKEEPLPYPGMEKLTSVDSVIVVKSKQGDKVSSALRIDGTKNLTGIMLEQFLPECFAIEYDLCMESLPAKDKSNLFNPYFIDMSNISEVRKIEFYEKPVSSNQWEHWRIEYVTIRMPAESYIRIRKYKDEEFISDVLAKCSEVKILPWVNRCVALLDNIRVFEIEPYTPGSKVCSLEPNNEGDHVVYNAVSEKLGGKQL